MQSMGKAERTFSSPGVLKHENLGQQGKNWKKGGQIMGNTGKILKVDKAWEKCRVEKTMFERRYVYKMGKHHGKLGVEIHPGLCIDLCRYKWLIHRGIESVCPEKTE